MNATQPEVVAVGGTAPSFTVSAGPGSPCCLRDLLFDGPALLVFFSTSCASSSRAIPAYAQLDRRFGDMVPVVAIGDDQPVVARAWVARRGFSGLVVVDDSPERSVFAAFGLTVLPAAFLIDRAGIVLGASIGSDGDAVNALTAILGRYTGRDGRPVPQACDGPAQVRPP